jgi:histone-lysine N-methyltransferase SUV39H
MCVNYLTNSPNKHKWKVVVKRVTKHTNFFGKEKSITMWGLFALEPIPAGAYVVDYVGEVLTAKDGDKRGRVYDSIGMSYLFDMNEPDETDEYDMKVQQSAYEDFFPLCVDAAYYGNESRFINHSCEPNLKSFNLVSDVESYTFHTISFFATKNIFEG